MSNYAWTGQGNCQYFEFPAHPDGNIDWPYTVKVIEQDALVEDSATSTTGYRVLDFNSSLRVTDVQGCRARVKEVDAYHPLGWIERSSLLCRLFPLSNKTGGFQKVIISPAKDIVRAYPSRDLMDCAGQCQQLFPYSGYFVFDESPESFLLGEYAQLDDCTSLVGWVSKHSCVSWDTGYGIRPAPKHLLEVYSSLDDVLLHSSKHARICGNNDWLLSRRRMFVLETLQQQDRKIYHVLLAFPENQVVQSEVEGFEAYIPWSDGVVEDFWVTSENLDQWISLLREFEQLGNIYEMDNEDWREKFVFVMADALEKILRRPLYETTDVPLKDYLRQEGGLPVRDDSPAFRYSIEQLMNPKVVPDCELRRLILWLCQSRQLLEIIYHGNQQPRYVSEPFPGECPAGEDIPFIPGTIEAVPLGANPELRYDHDFQKVHFYWIPKQYLP